MLIEKNSYLVDAIRWNFIQSEVPVHRKRMMIDKKGWSRHFRRAIQKKVMQSKQQLKDLEAAKKNFQVTTQVRIFMFEKINYRSIFFFSNMRA